MAPLKRICLTGKTCSVGKVQKSLCYGQSDLHSGELDVHGRKGRETCTSCCCAEFSINSRNQQIRSKTHSRTQTTGTGRRGTQRKPGTRKEPKGVGESQSNSRACCRSQIFLRTEYNLSLDIILLRTHHVLLDYNGTRSPCS